MNKEQQMVHDWHVAMGVPDTNRKTFGFPNKDTCKLRVDLIQEELNELKSAIEEKDFCEIADALGDLLFVVYGAACAFGLDLEPVFAEVHKSNMSKVPLPGELPEYNSAGKLMKPKHFVKPDILTVITKLMEKEND